MIFVTSHNELLKYYDIKIISLPSKLHLKYITSRQNLFGLILYCSKAYYPSHIIYCKNEEGTKFIFLIPDLNQQVDINIRDLCQMSQSNLI